MDELVIRFASIHAKLKALKSALNEDQILHYNASMNKSKSKALENLKEPTQSLLQLIDELYQ